MGILSLLLWTPVVGILVLSFTSGTDTRSIRFIANLFATLAFLVSCWLIIIYDQQDSAIQFSEQFTLNPKLGSALALGVDGLSIPMLVLAALLTSVAMLASFTISHGVKSFHICILLLEFGMLGVFLAQDWAMFYIFWELTLIPLFFLIDRWGGKRRHTASLNFVLYTMGGSIFMLISLLAIGHYMPAHGGSLMPSMTEAARSMPRDEQVWVLLGPTGPFGLYLHLLRGRGRMGQDPPGLDIDQGHLY